MFDTSDLNAFKAALDGIRFHDGHSHLAARSRDYFWYSPILNDQLKDKIGDLLVG